MKNENMVVYAEVDVIIKQKGYHQKRRFLNKRNQHTGIGFFKDYGDIPVWTYNDITRKAEPVVNNRGIAYAHRNASRYKQKKQIIVEEV